MNKVAGRRLLELAAKRVTHASGEIGPFTTLGKPGACLIFVIFITLKCFEASKFNTQKFINFVKKINPRQNTVKTLPDGATCISYKFSHQMAPLALLPNLVTRWRHMH